MSEFVSECEAPPSGRGAAVDDRHAGTLKCDVCAVRHSSVEREHEAVQAKLISYSIDTRKTSLGPLDLLTDRRGQLLRLSKAAQRPRFPSSDGRQGADLKQQFDISGCPFKLHVESFRDMCIRKLGAPTQDAGRRL